MSESSPKPTRITRRTLLKAGIAGGAALVLVRWLYFGESTNPSAESGSSLGPTHAVLAAIVPELLAGALPTEDAVASRAEIVAGVDRTIAGLPPATRKELDELFSLLSFIPTRCLLAGIWSPWPQASPESIAAFLVRWRDSRFSLLRSGYGALHQLVLASWYANPRAWKTIGYAGPPTLSAGV